MEPDIKGKGVLGQKKGKEGDVGELDATPCAFARVFTRSNQHPHLH